MVTGQCLKVSPPLPGSSSREGTACFDRWGREGGNRNTDQRLIKFMSGLFRSWGNLSLSTNRILSQIIFIEGTVFFVKAPAGVCPRNRHKLLAEIWDSRGQEGPWSGLSLPAWHWALFPNAPSLLVTSQASQSQGQLSGHEAGSWYSVLSASGPQRMRCKEMGAWQTGCREQPGLGSP